ncbi:Exosome complex component RRP4-like protein, partial [Bienertia sinuspersici]
MRDIELSLNQTQKIRLQRSLDKLQSLSSTSNCNSSVTVADTIPVNYEDGVLKGHGTSELEGEVIATVCGVVERVNKLVYVRSLRSRYKPETGDIIVGRIVEVSQKRWRVEINSNQDAVLMLSSVTLPDGIQAEVRNLQHDGTWQLHARSDKRKQHFHQLDQYGVLLILGCNGYVWVGELIEAKDSMETDDVKESEKTNADSSLEVSEQSYTAAETRQNICRIANAIRVLSILGFNITIELILEIVNLSTSLNLDIHDMLGAEFCVAVAEKEAERRST